MLQGEVRVYICCVLLDFCLNVVLSETSYFLEMDILDPQM